MKSTPSENRSETMPLTAALRRLDLRVLLWQERRVVMMALAAAVIAPLAAMALPLATRAVVDEVIGKGRGDRLVPLGLLAAVGLRLQAGGGCGAAHHGSLAGVRIAARLGRRLQQPTLRVPAPYCD